MLVFDDTGGHARILCDGARRAGCVAVGNRSAPKQLKAQIEALSPDLIPVGSDTPSRALFECLMEEIVHRTGAPGAARAHFSPRREIS